MTSEIALVFGSIVKIPKMKNKYCRKNAYFETFVFRKLSFGIAVVVPMV